MEEAEVGVAGVEAIVKHLLLSGDPPVMEGREQRNPATKETLPLFTTALSTNG